MAARVCVSRVLGVSALLVAAAAFVAVTGSPLSAQGRAGGQGPGGRGGAAATPQSVAPVDFTGTWVPLITEDWRFRMVTPPVGDTASIPITPAGQKVADSWDPAADASQGVQCKAYGAAGIMRMPTRIRMSWDNATTLKMEADAGQQTRLFRFDPPAPPSGDAGWQGYSVAKWETMQEGQGIAPAGPGRGGRGQAPPLSGGLSVVTTHMRPGYLRRNGVPYSGDAVMTEYFDAFPDANGSTYLVVSTTIVDPMYLNQPFITSTHFKKEPDNSKWNPRPCEITAPVVGEIPR